MPSVVKREKRICENGVMKTTRTSRPPLWAMLLIARICADHGRRAPRLTWWNGRSSYSSGHCNFERRIHITAGTDVRDQQLVVMHEVAHYLTTPRNHAKKRRNVWHSKRFWEKAFELYARYGDPAFVEFAQGREGEYRKTAAAIGSRLPRHPVLG